MMNMMAMQQQSYVRLYVGNLSFDTTQIDLWDLFRGAAGQSGKASPIQVQIQFSPEGLSKGWALVDFPDADSAEFCIQVFNGFEFGDRVLNVRHDRSQGGGVDIVGQGTPMLGGMALGGFYGGDYAQGSGILGAPADWNANANSDGAGGSGGAAGGTSSSSSVYVGNLSWQTTSEQLKDIFEGYGPTSAEVQVGRDGRSRGYGLLKFDSEEVSMRAINEMNGYEHDGRSLTVRIDQPSQGRKKQGGGGYGASGGRVRSRGVVGNGQGGSKGAQGSKSAKGKKDEQRPRNYAATVFCGNLPWGVTWQQLKDVFAGEGLSPEYADVKIGYDGRSRGWGTVRFADMEAAHRAANEMNGYMLDGRRLDVHLDQGPSRNNRGGRGNGNGDDYAE